MIYTRQEVEALMSRRRSLPEGTGPDAYMEFKVRITPELLDMMMGSAIDLPDGSIVSIDAINVSDDGYAELILRRL